LGAQLSSRQSGDLPQFSGTGRLQDGAAERAIGPNQVAIYTLRDNRLRATRSANSLHRFLTLEFVARLFAHAIPWRTPKPQTAHPALYRAGGESAALLEIKALPASLFASRVQFVEPPVSGPARRAWYLGRVIEILAQTVFPDEDPHELFCQKHQRTNRERSERVRYLVERDLANPPSLEMLAEEVGCSTFYLSRIFAQETGASIPKFLRMKRIEKAAELIRTGKMNVTGAAMEVGYSSLSAFSKAFVETDGLLPRALSARQDSGPQTELATALRPARKICRTWINGWMQVGIRA